MCTRPVTREGNTFACRTCDECIATRRHGWVARAMAEKSGWPFALCIALTYSDETPEGRDGARMFCYADVRDFMKRLRRAADYQAQKLGQPKPTIRFLCAGEQGDRNGRCHWHMILYSDIDLSSLGTFTGRFGPVTDRADMLTIGKRKRRLNWSLWPMGFVTLQEPDQGAMNYVLSYCLKDQFTAEKSRGTRREAKSENFATGLFRMSKRPAIGHDFLMRKLEALEAKGAVLPSLKLTIPGFRGYWHPNGSFREKLLWGLVALNQRVVWATGANAPQWATLLASCSDNEKDMEILNGLPTPPEQDPEHPDFTDWERSIANRGRTAAIERERAEFAARCSNALPCTICLHDLDEDTLASIGVRRIWPEDGGAWRYEAQDGYEPVGRRQNDRRGRSNPFCQSRGFKLSRLVFPHSDPAPRAAKRNITA